ncbi:hypothetical protein PSQ20_03305 [Curvibacter sp. RS43]|uniref:Uncharacterized protein n=1 Tax=Curvibacter microcysteis TaxID=3026419 RepID=A0ABT5MCY4_9BURK|nr:MULTISPECIES: hypothetical protein [unclassified Curvibacter]MDD0809351.1 hypothetical protein [Curvibacter sp. RS43]MDD0814448.1 hypothetical protein [Curvibacter sp. HBC28]
MNCSHLNPLADALKGPSMSHKQNGNKEVKKPKQEKKPSPPPVVVAPAPTKRK